MHGSDDTWLTSANIWVSDTLVSNVAGLPQFGQAMKSPRDFFAARVLDILRQGSRCERMFSVKYYVA